jgi:hypothetical protein
MSNIINIDTDPTSKDIPLPENIEFVFHFSESDIPVSINNAIIQTYPNYLSLADDTHFFDEVNRMLLFMHNVTHYQNGIGETRTYITDSQGRIFQIDLLHVSGVPT